jgi:hypothetical protein
MRDESLLSGWYGNSKVKSDKIISFPSFFELIWGIAKNGPHHKVTAGVQEKQSRLSLPAF